MKPAPDFTWMSADEAIDRLEDLIEVHEDGADHADNAEWLFGLTTSAFPVTSLDQNSAFDYALDVVALRRAIEALERVRELEAENARLRDQLQAQANEAAGFVERLARAQGGAGQ